MEESRATAVRCRMKRHSAHAQFVIASLLTLVLVATTAIPAAAAPTPRRASTAEDLAVRLVNCIRTGGRVTARGTCKGWGSGRYSVKRPPLKRSARISNQVTWPWARRTVKLRGTRSCWVGHSLSGSTVDRRFRWAGLRHTVNGENIGCASYRAKKTVILIVRWWQREKSYGGWHWRQIKDPRFKSMGVGVAKLGTRKAQVAVNFYGKRVR